MKKLIIMLMIALLLFGCIDLGGEQPKPVGNKTVENETEQKVAVPSFTIQDPTEGFVFESEDETAFVDVVLDTKDLLITRNAAANKAGEGYFVFYVDNEKMGDVYTKRYTIEGVGMGEHTLKVVLVHNDGSHYAPEISKDVSFTVEKKVVFVPPKTVDVSINDFSYVPAEVTINVGDSVRWLNNAKFPRSATDGTPSFSTGTISAGDFGTVIFSTPGEYEYFSANYPLMKGKVIVVEQ